MDDEIFTGLELKLGLDEELDPGFDAFEGFAPIPEKRAREIHDIHDEDDVRVAKKVKTGEDYVSPYSEEESMQAVLFMDVPPQQLAISYQNYQAQLKALKLRADEAISERNKLRPLAANGTIAMQRCVQWCHLYQQLAETNNSLRKELDLLGFQNGLLIDQLEQMQQAQAATPSFIESANKIAPKNSGSDKTSTSTPTPLPQDSTP